MVPEGFHHLFVIAVWSRSPDPLLAAPLTFGLRPKTVFQILLIPGFFLSFPDPLFPLQEPDFYSLSFSSDWLTLTYLFWLDDCPDALFQCMAFPRRGRFEPSSNCRRVDPVPETGFISVARYILIPLWDTLPFLLISFGAIFFPPRFPSNFVDVSRFRGLPPLLSFFVMSLNFFFPGLGTVLSALLPPLGIACPPQVPLGCREFPKKVSPCRPPPKPSGVYLEEFSFFARQPNSSPSVFKRKLEFPCEYSDCHSPPSWFFRLPG